MGLKPVQNWTGEANPPLQSVRKYSTSQKFGDTYSFQSFFIFTIFLHCRIIGKTSKLWNNTWTHVVTQKSVKQITNIFDILQIRGQPINWTGRLIRAISSFHNNRKLVFLDTDFFFFLRLFLIVFLNGQGVQHTLII